LTAEVVENLEETVIVRFEFEGDFWKILEKWEDATPPYIHNDNEKLVRETYQTSMRPYGSAAAPTADCILPKNCWKS